MNLIKNLTIKENVFKVGEEGTLCGRSRGARALLAKVTSFFNIFGDIIKVMNYEHRINNNSNNYQGLFYIINIKSL